MSEWRLGRQVGEARSIWRRPAQAGLVVGALHVLPALTQLHGLDGFAVVGVLLWQFAWGFLLGFFAAVILLTYSKVAQPD